MTRATRSGSTKRGRAEAAHPRAGTLGAVRPPPSAPAHRMSRSSRNDARHAALPQPPEPSASVRGTARLTTAWTATPWSAGELADPESEVPVPDPVAGECHRDHAHPFQPVRHGETADVQRAQADALDERRHARLRLRTVAGDEDVGSALLQDVAEDGVERLHHAGAGGGHLGDLPRDRGLLVVSQPVEGSVEG